MDYYKILNISENTSLDDIKKSYRKKTLEYYKNNNKNIEILNEAYNYFMHNHDKITTFNNDNIDNVNRVRSINLSEKIYSEDNKKNNQEMPQDIMLYDSYKY
ncbi:MAG: DnaJ domain-containing protein [Planctomycetota bacterium]|jgi:curved DNA-binding protein CbpA